MVGIDKERQATVLLVNKVASQGNFLAPNAIRTAGTLSTSRITAAGRAKYKTCNIDAFTVLTNSSLFSEDILELFLEGVFGVLEGYGFGAVDASDDEALLGAG